MGISPSKESVSARFYTELTDHELERFINKKFLYCKDSNGDVWKATELTAHQDSTLEVVMSKTTDAIPTITPK